jgi:hypothetical protein
MAITVATAFGDMTLVPNYAHSGVPVNGTSGTLATFCEPGDLLTNITAGPPAILYQNTGTSASPIWTQITVP